MMSVTRPAAPDFLVECGERWTAKYIARRLKDSGAVWNWPTHRGVVINQRMLPMLREMTARHCAYCDHFELGVDGSIETIDHFQPKSVHPERVVRWDNLFLACTICQKNKGDVALQDALRPDVIGYSFERYFFFDSLTGEIGPNLAASPDLKDRAQRTIEWLGLNRDKRPASRLREWRRRMKALRQDPNAASDPELVFRFLPTERTPTEE